MGHGDCTSRTCAELNVYVVRLGTIVFYVVDIIECDSNPCENGGTCTDAVNGYTCKCVAGYTDRNCQTGVFVYLR